MPSDARGALAVAVATLLVAAMQGCGDDTGTGGGGGATTTTNTGGATTTSSGGGGEGGGLPGGCLPAEGEPIAAICGVFVQLGATGTGTQSAPFGSIVEASENLGGAKAIYVCGQDTFTGSVSLPGGVSLFGSLECATWTYVTGVPRPVIEGAPDAVALTITGAGTSTVQSVSVTAPNAIAPGASSIAVVIDGATVNVAHADFSAQDGVDGDDGMAAPNTNTAIGATGNMGINACVSTTTNNGGPDMVNTCAADVSIGGQGGSGKVLNGDPGSPGQVGTAGQNGIGQPNVGAWSCAVGTGGGGDNGSPGSPGSPGSGKGALASTGFTPADGGDGMSGTPGQGGGGGGGAKGMTSCAGASGGSGGSGGCGGIGGAGGKGGGSSFALVSLDATITLTEAVLSSALGKKGGDGGSFQPGAGGGAGAPGGTGMSGTLNACPGGLGGQGGNGGGGGGGRGGHSAPIVFVGTAPTVDAMTTLSSGLAGAPGIGVGNGMDAGQDGLAGTACSVMDFNGGSETCAVN